MIRQVTLILFFCVSAGVSRADEVGRFSNDWTGNGIVVEAVADPKVGGVTCHLVHFDRSVIDRLTKGNWFENPSNSSISCQQTGPIVIGKIVTGAKGEEVFSERMRSAGSATTGPATVSSSRRLPTRRSAASLVTSCIWIAASSIV